MNNLILFGILSLPVIIVSWRSLFSLSNHGFYRFLSWECIVWLLLNNYHFWFTDPLSTKQLISWILLIISLYMLLAGLIEIKKSGRQDKSRKEASLYHFEKTTKLIDSGIYRHIRHPMYSSLLFLSWGIYFKNTEIHLLAAAALASVFLLATAIFDEKGCINYFGIEYKNYMKKTKRFIPFLF